MTRFLTTTSTLVALTLAAPPAFAQNDGTNVDPAAVAAAPGPVAVLDAAHTLAEFGRAQGSSALLIAAARALQMIGTSEPDGDVTAAGPIEDSAKPVAEAAEMDKPESGPASGPESAQAALRDLLAGLLDEARFLARGDEMLLASIAEVEEAATRGSPIGPGCYNQIVNAGDYIVIREAFVGNRIAEVSLRGDGDTDLDLFIYDERGNEICASIGWDDREFCRWTPAWTGPFEIVVENLGRVWNAARICTN